MRAGTIKCEQRFQGVALLAIALFLAALLLAPSASADVDVCTAGSGAGQCNNPRDVVVDAAAARLYVADSGNRRVDIFDADTGQFEFAFGWGVADGNSAELQTCSATCFKGLSGAGAGQFGSSNEMQLAVDPSSHDLYVFNALRVQRFSFDDNGTPADSSDDSAVFERTWGGGVVTGGAEGTGDLEAGSATVANIKMASKAFQVGQTITGSGIPVGTKIVSVGFDNSTIMLSQPATASGIGVALTVAEGSGNVPVNEVQVLTIRNPLSTYDPTDPFMDDFSLQFRAPAPSSAKAVTPPILTNATPAEVQSALEALPNVDSGDLTVTSPNPGGEVGVKGGPYTISFSGRYADTDVSPVEQPETGGVITSVVINKTTKQNGGSGAEICTAGNAGDCIVGVAGNDEGQFSSPEDSLAIGPDGTVFVGSTWLLDGFTSQFHLRVQKFDPTGAFVDQFSFSEDKGRRLLDVAVDSNSDIYASLQGKVNKYDLSGNLLGADFTSATTLSVDPADDLFASGGSVGFAQIVGRISRLDSSGLPLSNTYTTDGKLGSGIAPYHSPTGDIFVSDGEKVVHIPYPQPGPFIHRWPLLTATASVRSSKATLHAAIDPEGKATTFRFEYVPEAIYEADVAAEGPGHGFDHASSTPPAPVGSDVALHQVSFDVSGLAPETTYRFRAVATNADGTDIGPEGEPFTTLDPLEIGDTWSSEVGLETARLHAEVNPLGTATTGYFEYVTAATCLADEEAEGPEHCFDHATQLPDVAGGAIPLDFGAGETPKEVSRLLFPLPSDTAYRFRIVVKDHCKADPEVVCTFTGPKRSFRTFAAPQEAGPDCPNGAFRTGPSASLPDCRAYELVSPVDKNSSDVIAASRVIDQASEDGDALTFAGLAAFAGAAGGPFIHQYMAERDPALGWSTRSIAAPRNGTAVGLGLYLHTPFKFFSGNLCSGWLAEDTDTPLLEGAPRGVPNLYRRQGLREGCGEDGYELLTTVFPSGFDPQVETIDSRYFPMVQGFSADGRVSAFRADAALGEDACDTPEEGKGIIQVYLSEEGVPGVAPRLISVLPGGEAACTHSSLGTAQSFDAGSYQKDDGLHHAISDDGTKAFWTATGETTPVHVNNDPTSGSVPGRLYLRLNPTEPQSAFANFTGTGKLVEASNEVTSLVAAAGKVTLTAGSSELTALEATTGQFVAGQPIEGKGIPTGSTVLEATPVALVISAAVEAGKSGTKVSISSPGPAPFEVGQAIAGEGIPAGTTILAAEAGKLTLSAVAKKSKSKATLTASSCSEPDAACTIAVSAQAEALAGTGASRYLSAAADGSVAIFQSDEDLYEFDVEKALAEEEATTLIAHEVKGIMGASSDASRIYLVSGEVLNEGASAGKPNLYLYERGAGFAFIATLGNVDTSNGLKGSGSSPIAAAPSRRLSRVSPDGLHAAFASADPALAETVAGYDNTDATSGEPNREVYLYDATANSGGKLVCVSCNPSGARPRGRLVEGNNGNPGSVRWAVARIPGWTTSWHPSNVLSANGSRLFFESFEGLVPRDTNGRQDVYEWQPAEGREQCLEAIGGELFVPDSGGCLGLISSGLGAEDSEFVDASADGRDVFFITGSSLLPQDTSFRDIYDARALGGFPAPDEPEPACEGDACQSPPAAPNDPTPASAAFQGAGNVREASSPICRKGKVRRRGRCVAKHKRHKRANRRAHANRRASR